MDIMTRIQKMEEKMNAVEMQLTSIREELAMLRNNLPRKRNNDNRQLLNSLVSDAYKLKVIDKALAKGLLAISEAGQLYGCMSSKTLVAYFIGRLWSGDEIYYDKVTKEPCWRTCLCFPSKLANQLFEEKSLRDLRKNRRDMPLPKGHELIDELF